MSINTASLQQLYVTYFNRPADVAGLAYWEAALTKGATLATVSAAFNKSAEYTSLFTGKTNEQIVDTVYQNLFGRGATDVAGLLFWVGHLNTGALTVANVAEAISKGALTTDLTALNNKVTAATTFTTALDTTTEIIAYASATTEAFAPVKAWLSTVTTDASLATAIVPATLATVTAPFVAVVPAQTFTLTTGLNTGAAFTGGDGNDTFNAVEIDVNGTPTAVWTIGDAIDGGKGNDTFNVLQTGAITTPVGTTVTGIETANLTSGGAISVDASGWTGLTSLNVKSSVVGAGDFVVTAATTTVVSVTASGATGDFTLTGGKNVTVSGTAADGMLIKGAVGTATITAGAESADILSVDAQGLTSVTVLDGGIVAIGDGLTALADVAFNGDAITDTLTTVSVTGNAGVLTINSDVLTSLTLGNSNQNATVTAAAGTRALALTVNKLTGGTIADAEATTLNLSTTGTATTGVTINAAKATSATIDADVALTATLGLDVATSLAISGNSIVTATALSDKNSLASVTITGSAGLVADLSDQTALTAITATGTSGNNTVTVDATKATYAGGSGVDSVTVLATVTKAINGGDGSDDVFTWNVDGSYTTDTDVTGFEVIGAGALVNADTISATGFTRMTQAGIAGAVTWSNVAANSTLTITANPGFGTTVLLADPSGETDKFNLTLTKSGAVGALVAGTVVVAGVETIAITSDDSDTTLVSPLNTLTLTAAAVKTLTVGGDAGLNLTYTGTTATTVDASGITAGAFTWTAGALAAANVVKGSATGTNTVDLTNSIAGATTYTGGTGTDTITVANIRNNNIDLGGGTTANTVTSGDATGNNTVTSTSTGTDNVTLGSGNNIVSLGNGINNFTAGAGNNTYTGGTGVDTVVVTTGANTINVGGGTTANSVTVGAASGLNVITTTSTGVDTFVLAGIQTTAANLSTLSGWTAGDIINVADVTTGASAVTPLGAKISMADNTTLATYLNEATKTDLTATGATSAALITWFQFGGDTYIVVDNFTKPEADSVDTITFQNGVDSVIKLVGLIDLSTSTVAADVITIV